LKLIVTRPETAASKTAEKLRSLGHEVSVSPMLEIVATETDMPSDDFSMIIITSANALQILEKQDFEHSLLDTPLYVVGDQTSKIARDIGFINVHSAAGNAKNLVELIKSCSPASQTSQKSALYICGKHSTSGFIDDLSMFGLNIKVWINYKANLVDQLTNNSVDFLSTGNSVGVLLYSARSARQFSKLIDHQKTTYTIENMSIFVLSSMVKKALSEDLQKVTRIAQKPDEQSLFALIAS
jgi:uroporphyrinogen-III synthase